MNITLSGLQIVDLLHEGVNTVIYRGRRDLEPTSVIIKTLKTEYPTLEEIARLRHEYKILQPLEIEGVVKSYELKNYHHGLALILEDFGGQSLKQVIKSQKIDLIDFLKIAIHLTQTLGELHRYKVIHKDIKPHNILFKSETEEIKIIDFSIATYLEKENQSLSSPNLLEGTLAYMSPEQTGRMNRSIDYRTDFYSLGVTFYEMLTGQLPFNSTDPMEIVHCHIAKRPIPPHLVETRNFASLHPEISLAVSSIVMKLMAKTAEERYQSAQGLRADLEECLSKLQVSGTIENFIPGRLDRTGQFLIPQKLYGRENEVKALLEAFARVADGGGTDFDSTFSLTRTTSLQTLLLTEDVETTSNETTPLQGKSEMMLVSGYSGIGKTCLIYEIHKPIVAARGYFISGKFDQFKRNIPYAALTQAFSYLVQQLLTENSEQIAIWKEKILEALGPNGRIISDVIPEIELIVGTQPDVPSLGSTESQNRFNRVFKQFIQVFAKKEHPLVLFLDDLQWADLASLKLIKLLITEPDSQYLLLMGAYRDNEVSPTHPTILTVEEIKKTGAIVNNIVLQPLAFPHVSQLVADTLNHEMERSKPLADLLFNKTQGNPFFLTQLFKTLYNDNLLTFDFFEGRWLWELDRIQAIGITDYNVIELVARNIQKLPESTQQVLKLAACIGNQFNLDVLAIVNEKDMGLTSDELWSALQAGLILPLSNAYKIPLFIEQSDREVLKYEDFRVTYKFLHDRVQQAAYSLIPEDQKKATHLKIGQLLWQKTAKYALSENIFDIVNQMNIGVDLIIEQLEKEKLANLNLIAGKKAKAATAYEAAVRYLNVGLKLLPEKAWQSQYELTRDVHLELLEAEYLTTNFERAQQLSDIALSQVQTLLEKVKIYELKIPFYFSQNQLQEALETALQILKMLGVNLPKKPGKINIMLELIKTKLAVGNKRIADFTYLPKMTDPYKIAALRILMATVPATFNANPALFPLIIFKMVNLCIQYGNSPLSAYGYCMYGMFLCGILGDIDSGYQFGQLALKILEQFDAKNLKAKIYLLFNNFVRHWKEPIGQVIETSLEAFQSGLETGDTEYACNCAWCYCTHLFWSGEHLESVAKIQAQYIDVMQKYKHETISEATKIWNQVSLNLKETSIDKCSLVGDAFDENKMICSWTEANNKTGLASIYLAKSMLFYFFKDYKKSVESAKLTENNKEGLSGLMMIVEHNFYYSLALLASHNRLKAAKNSDIKIVLFHQKQMKKWASFAPTNYQHKYELVEAEIARVLGQDTQAMQLYDRAIQGAKDNGYIQEEALAYELAAEFYLARGKEKIAKTYMTDAYYGYIRWGAKAKVRDLDERYLQLISRSSRSEANNFDTTRTNSTTGKESQILDLTTVIKASLVLSSEIVLSNLLNTLMKVVIENAGAQKGYFITKQDERWVIEAEGISDRDEEIIVQTIPLEAREKLPISLLNYVKRTRKNLVLDDARKAETFAHDPYFIANQPKSILCLPIIHQSKLTGILYLENNLATAAFTSDRLKVLNLLSSQISISIDNARLYTNLQKYSQQLEVSETRERFKAEQLEQSLHKLQQTQAQLVQTEKISSLGQLVAGLAHEVNNPVNYISGNINYASEYVQNLLNLIRLYQQEYPKTSPLIQEETEAIELDYIIEDLPKILSSMKLGTDRIKEIMQSLRNFSRIDDAQKKPVNITDGLESTLMILSSRLKGKGDRKVVSVVKEYGTLPLVEGYGGQLNQVFMNLIANAIDALEEFLSQGIDIEKPQIRIRTEVIDGDKVAIRIADNGPGMTEAVRAKLFDAFFTTKPEGKGTGLGLSISYQIVVEKHQGNLYCISAPGQGAEFVIEIPITSPDNQQRPDEPAV